MEPKLPDIEEFLTFFTFSKRTETLYRSAWKLYGEYLASVGLSHGNAAAQDIRNFMAARGYSISSREHVTKYLISIYDWAISENLLDCDNPAEQFKAQEKTRNRKKPPKRLPVALTKPEQEKLLEASKTVYPGFTGCRVRALIHLLLATGARISEALDMKIGDLVLDDDNPHARVIGKNDKERIIPLTGYAILEMEKWLDAREQYGARSDWLFANLRGGKYMPSSAWKIMAKLLERIEVKKPMRGPHILRHTFITRQLEAGKPPAIVKSWVGHENLSVMFSVYEHVIAQAGGVMPA